MDSVNNMISIGQATVSLELREVFSHGVPLRVGTRAFDILEFLISCPGRLVTKDEILRRVWPDTVVEENNLQVHVSALRKALGADRDLIRTIPGRGYMLIGSEDDARLIQPTETAGADISGSHADALLRCSELPHDIALIGREGAVEEICEALLGASLLSLVGSGGIGKTALAIRVAHQLALTEGWHVCFVPLAPLSCAERIVEALASALNLEAIPEQSILESIIECLEQRNRLIILDNGEHLIDSVAKLSEQLLHRCPSLKILVTSREPLRINRERSVSVTPLVVPSPAADRFDVLHSSAARLFLTRLRALDSAFPADESAALDGESVALIGAVCRTLDGIPLALEMAAARAATLGLFELASSLEHNVHLLCGGLRSAPQRHQSLDASVDWSYRLLDADERRVLGRLGELCGRFSLDEACEIAQTADLSRSRVMDCIVGLAQKSLLVVSAEGPFRFYRLLGATRTWVAHRLSKTVNEGASRRNSGHDSQLSVTPERVSSLATLRSTTSGHDSDYFHRNHQRVLATSQ